MTRNRTIGLGVLGCLLVFAAVQILGVTTGCQKSATQGGSKGSEVPSLVSGRLPELGDYLPPLDEGRLEVAPPKDWVVSPRSESYIVRFQADSGSTYPTVLVVGTNSERFKAVTPENLEAFAKSVAAELESAGTKTTVKIGRVGDMIGVTYTRRAKVKDNFGGIVERLFFDTVVAGRRYQFELRCPPEMVGLAEPYFYAIVSGAKVHAVGELESEEVTEAPPKAEEKPAAQGEQKSAEKQPPASEQAKSEALKPEAKPSHKPAGEKTPPPEKSQAKPAEQAPTEKPKEETKAPEKPPAEPQPAKEAAPESKPEEKPKEKKTEDLLKDVDALLQ